MGVINVTVGDNVLLNNGKSMVFIGYDEWLRPLLRYVTDSKRVETYVVVDNLLHSRTRDGEPCCPLKGRWQFKFNVVFQ